MGLRWQRFVAPAAAVVLVLVAAGECDLDWGKKDVSGHLIMAGGPPPGVRINVPGQVLFRRSGTTVTVKTARDGSFHVKLTRGTYAVNGRSPNYGGNQGLCRLSRPLVVKHDLASIIVTCNMS